MFAMLGLQLKSLQTDASSSALVHNRMEALVRQLENEVGTPEGKIRLSILAGENLGPDAALKRLAELEEGKHSREVSVDIETLRAVYTDGPDAVGWALRERLNQRYEYLGRLALAYGVPMDKEPRKTLVDQALWFTLRAGSIVMILVAVLVLSLGVFVAGCVWFFKGKIQPARIPDTSSLEVFLEAFALYLALFLISGRLIRLVGGVSVQWTWITLFILPIVWKWITVRISAKEFREALGWYRGQGFIRESALGIAGYLAGLPMIAVGCFISYVLIRLTGTPAASPLFQELNGGLFALIGLYGLSCIFAPFMEETMFRGVFLHHLRQRWRWIVSAPIVAVIFALLHPQGWVAVPALASIAIVLAALREWRGSLIAPMAAHACHNFFVVTLALLLLR
jgi:membrane protease YdiL (CAAX protease family)